MKLVNSKINLCFVYDKKYENEEETSIIFKTAQKELIKDSSNKNNWIEFSFNSIVQFNNVNIEKEFINIFIEINEEKLRNPQNDECYYFSFVLNELNNKKFILLKIEDVFTISFNVFYYKNDDFDNNNKNDKNDNDKNDNDINDNDINDDKKIERKLSFESIASVDSSLDNYFNEDLLSNKEDKIKIISKANSLFERLKGETKFINLKNFRIKDIHDEISLDLERNEEPKIKEDTKNDEKLDNVEMILNNTFEYENNNENKDINHILRKKKKEDSVKKYEGINNINYYENKEFRKNKVQQLRRVTKLEEKEDCDKILPSMDYESYLKTQNNLKKNKNREQTIRETFCLGFFMTSIPFQNPKINEHSEQFPANCMHKSCSILKSMQPEILMRYPLEDTEDVEINNLSATMCFPTGIKICYCEQEKRPEKMDDYLTLMTNRKGDRLFIMTYHFYVKMNKSEFDKKSKNNALELKLKKCDELIKTIDLQEIDENTYHFFEELKICKEFEYRNHIYIPYCLALISKYPYINEMKKSIICIFEIIENQVKNNNLELNELLMYLIHSIPIPNTNTNIEFPLPYYDTKNKNDNKITLEPLKIKDMNILNSNFCELLKIFRNKNIIRIFRLLLFEKKIVFIDKDYSRLTDIMNCFLSLIYPFQWTHVYIPILSIPMMKYLETFLPFLVGVHPSFLPYISKHLIINSDEKDQVYLIFVEEDKIRISDSLNGDMKKLNKTRFLHEDLVNLPIWMYLSLNNLLINIRMKMKSIKTEDFLLFNLEIQNAFIEIFIEMFSDYNKYIYKVGDEIVFNKKAFLSKKNLLEKKFYKEFLDTQMFLQFKEDILNEEYDYFKQKVAQRNRENKEKFKQTTLEKTRTIVNDFQEEKKRYKIKHKFINMIKKDENSSYMEDNYIIKYLKDIDNTKYDHSKCIIYLMPVLQTIGSMVKDTAIIYPNSDDDEIKEKKKLTEEERKNEHHIYKIEEQIKTFIVNIFESDNEESNNDSELILNIIKTEQKGREYFIKLISKNLTKLVIMQNNSFDILNNLILETLQLFLQEKDNSDYLYKNLVRLVKSTMNYGKEVKNKIITIWDLCHEKLSTIKWIYEEKFWDEWYIFEINNNINLNGVLLNKVKSQVMISISKTMKELIIDNSKIICYTDNLMKKYFGKDLDLIQKTHEDIIERIK